MHWNNRQRTRWFWIMMAFGAIFLLFMISVKTPLESILIVSVPYFICAVALLAVNRRSSNDT